MSKIQFILTHNQTINAIADGQRFVIPSDHPNYQKLLQAIRDDDPVKFAELADIPKSLSTYMGGDGSGKVKVENATVYYDGQPCNTEVANKILELMELNLPCDSMVNFLEKLMQNPSKHSVDELFLFLQNKGLPIAEDGDFYAYKRVNQDWTDCHSRKFDNSVGNRISVPRNTVDDDWRVACSSGFHIGAMDYVKNFNQHGRILIVKVNPKDVVSVPSYEVTKCRVCEYVVVAEYTGDLDDSPVYSAVEPHNSPTPVQGSSVQRTNEVEGLNVPSSMQAPSNVAPGSVSNMPPFGQENESFDDEDDFDDDDDFDDEDDYDDDDDDYDDDDEYGWQTQEA